MCARVCGHFDISLCNFPEASTNLNLNAGPGKTTGVEGNSGKKYLNCNYLYIVMYANDFKCQCADSFFFFLLVFQMRAT